MIITWDRTFAFSPHEEYVYITEKMNTHYKTVVIQKDILIIIDQKVVPGGVHVLWSVIEPD